jgi:radical SAM protein with 4Fe4S-binding SPASM domain
MMSDDPAGWGVRDLPLVVQLGQEALARRQLFETPDLNYLFWESTLKCNLRCEHCGSSCEPTSPVDELTTDQVIAVLQTIAEDFDAGRIHVSITGGEPLMRPDLYQVATRMVELGMTTCIVTNGTLLTVDRARRLVDTGMRSISISIDGPEREHDAVRGPGSFVKALAGITAAREAGIEYVEVITCVRPANLNKLDQTEQLVRGAGGNFWRLIGIDQMGRLAGKGETDKWLHPAQVRQMLDFIHRRRCEIEASGDDLDLRFSCGGFLGVRREKTVRPEPAECYAGLCVGSILADGKVGACPSMPRDWAQGSVLERRFSDIWYNEFRPYRDLDWRRSGVCSDCEFFNYCLGGGLHERLAQPDCFCWLERQRG